MEENPCPARIQSSWDESNPFPQSDATCWFSRVLRLPSLGYGLNIQVSGRFEEPGRPFSFRRINQHYVTSTFLGASALKQTKKGLGVVVPPVVAKMMVQGPFSASRHPLFRCQPCKRPFGQLASKAPDPRPRALPTSRTTSWGRGSPAACGSGGEKQGVQLAMHVEKRGGRLA